MAQWIGFSSVNDNKKSSKIYDIDLIKQDILNQFMCAKGSRLRNPEWGSIVWEKLFDEFNEALQEDIEKDCIRIVESDSRLALTSINLTKEAHGLAISLDLLYIPLNQSFDMYVTFNNNLTENQ